MARTIFLVRLFLVYLGLTIAAAAQASDEQTPTSQGPTVPTSQSPRIQNLGEIKQPNSPDMVCFGYGPKWTVQFTKSGARYFGVNKPEQYFRGNFYWVPDENAWEWHRADGLAPANGSFGLSATIQKEACHDTVLRESYPYFGQINLPQGDMVSGCCRKLKPDEAPVGSHGLEQTAPTPRVPPSTRTNPPPM